MTTVASSTSTSTFKHNVGNSDMSFTRANITNGFNSTPQKYPFK